MLASSFSRLTSSWYRTRSPPYDKPSVRSTKLTVTGFGDGGPVYEPPIMLMPRTTCAAANPACASRLQSLHPVRRVAELGSLGGLKFPSHCDCRNEITK